MARILFLIMLPFVCFSQITPREDIPVNNLLKEKENLDTKRKASYNLDEIKVRWKKAALENCPGVPCITNTVPGAPTGVVATAGVASAIVAFMAPSSNGGSAITGYTVTSNPGGITATGATSPINVTGLTNGTAYTFAVIATNAVGNSVASAASTAVTPVAPTTAPGAPTGVVATAGVASAIVAFMAPSSNGGSAITGYTVTSSPGGITATGATSPINVTGLTIGTAYTFAVIATNAVGNSVASAASTAVTPAAPFVCGTSTVTDVDGNVYNTKLIGSSQCWMTSNLKVTKYNDGTVIGDSTNSTWGTAIIGARTENKENSALPSSPSVSGYVGTLGYLYNWYAVNDARKICPSGWHVPTDAEWTILIQQFDNMASATVNGPQSTTAGTELKSAVTNTSSGSGLGWDPSFSPGTNTSGFSALPGGYRDYDGNFSYIRNRTIFHSATQYDVNNAWIRYLDKNLSIVFRLVALSNYSKSIGASVRCLRD